MAVFTYIAIDRSGRQTTGTIPADSRHAAFDQVLAQGLSPLSLAEQQTSAAAPPPRHAPRRVPQSAVESFTRELANLLAAGLPLSRGLYLLRREASHAGAKYVWSQIHEDVVGGMALADALAKWPRVFSSVYVAMVRAGEAGGFLHVVLQQIADFRTREQELKGKVKAAMVYPCVLGTLAIAVLAFLLTFFIPRFSSIFEDFGGKLPALTRAIIEVSHWGRQYGLFIAAAAIGMVVLVQRLSTTEAGQRALERVFLNTPLLGRVIARFALVRFSRMLGTLVGAGVPLVASLRVAREALGNRTLSDAITRATEEVQRGTSLSRSLAGTPLLFPNSVIEMIAVSEETGRLGNELVRISNAYETDLDRNLRMLVALAEPLMLFMMAAMIGTIVVGMLLPIFMLQDLIH
jgi:type II secretory pathway component PulF